eukprot:SAG22_NODE_506_length_9643_cov_5.853206_12_plen_44_part_00
MPTSRAKKAAAEPELDESGDLERHILRGHRVCFRRRVRKVGFW